jgi:hypothetical protein
MIGANRFCIELWGDQAGKYHVWIQPVEYLGHEEFKNWMRLCRRNFMGLTHRRPWIFENVFGDYEDAVRFAKQLARQVDEAVYFDRTRGQLQLVAPREETAL